MTWLYFVFGQSVFAFVCVELTLDVVPYFKRSEAARVYGDGVGVRGAGGPVPVRPAASWNNLHPCTKHFLARANDALAADAHLISTAPGDARMVAALLRHGVAAAAAADTTSTVTIASAAATAAHVAPRFREDAAYDADSAANTFDYNGAVHVGAGVAQVTANNGRRCDPAWAYLTPSVLVRPNLHVATGSRATRVIFEGDRATGVRYCCPTAGGSSGGGGGSSGSGGAGTAGGNDGGSGSAATAGPEHSVLATREVLLCAGAVGTPWLLLLSGVGPRQDLADKGVPVVADLEGVGANLVTPAVGLCRLNQVDP
jgi:choline dehydrogenase-like flavoprotein